MFVDQADIIVHGGAGGNGCAAKAKQPYSRYPRPSGGDGGNGGDVVLVADPQLVTLLDFHFRHLFRAGRGMHGQGNTRTGKRGEDRLVPVPLGTEVHDLDRGHLLTDVLTPGRRLMLAKGGRGGYGSASATQATPGYPGQERRLRLELKLIADVGLIGLPNAGKSSLLARISTAHPKIAAYPFTTREPVLGVVRVVEQRVFVACDIPGLIEGAHTGRGLGAQFLRHIERTRLLLHVVDLAAVDGCDPVDAVRQVNAELAAHNPELAARPQLIVANKMDLPVSAGNLRRVRKAISEPARPAHSGGMGGVWPISCATQAGIAELVQATWKQLQLVTGKR